MIYAKLDWYTCMLTNISISEVLKKLGCFDTLFEEIMEKPIERSNGYSSRMVYSCAGVSLEVKWEELMSVVDDDVSLINAKFSSMRVDISGSGLTFLRTLTPDFDRLVSNPDFWGENYKNLTRCDFAYDFVNYYPTFLDEFLSRLRELEDLGFLGSQYIGRVGPGGRFKYEYRKGFDISCIYLGSRGNRLIRIYDKLLEQTKPNGSLKNPFPEIFAENGDKDVSSWFRFEVQCRSKYAFNYLFNCNGNLEAVLRAVFDDFNLIDPEFREPFECIRRLVDFSKLPKIVYNLHYTELAKK